jgi:hypothetical protein
VWLTSLGVVTTVVMQIVKDDFFPPHDSMSQYGVGRFSWIFVLAVTLLGTGALALVAAVYAEHPGRAVRNGERIGMILVVLWGCCLIALGLIPADPTATAQTLSGHIHMGISGLGLLVLPFGATLLGYRPGVRSRRVQRSILVLAAASELSLVLLLLAAFGIDFSGLGPRAAWALYQSVAVVLDGVVTYLLISTLHTGRREPEAATNSEDARGAV